MNKIGDRVGAIQSADDGIAKFYGYGVYVGDEIPPESVDIFIFNFGMPNPKIELDSGKTVFGCECWWGSEEKIKAMLGRCHTVEIVDIDDARASSQHRQGDVI